VPEPKFFMTEAGRDEWEREYLGRWFDETGDAKAIGEKSTSYLECAEAPARMRRLFPNL
jgi:hypothetical protein